MRLRFATFNICSCRDHHNSRQIDPIAMSQAIARLNADVVLLNEVQGDRAQAGSAGQTQALAHQLGMQGFFARAIDLPSVGPYGNALLSRLPVQSFAILPIPDPLVRGTGYYETRCLLEARIDLGAGCHLTVLGSHFGLNLSEHENAVAAAVAAIRTAPRPLVLAGDFNLEPLSPLLQPILDLLRDSALSKPEDPLLTFPADKPDRKIDYILTSPGIRVLTIDAPGETTSDHRPLVADLEIL